MKDCKTKEKGINICLWKIHKDAFNKSEALIGAILQKMSGLNKARKKFLITYIYVIFRITREV